MATETKIQWTDSTFNPWRGCSKVHTGCMNCYAEAQAKRNPGTLGLWGPNGTRVFASPAVWGQPVKWNAAAQASGETHRVFCASLADIFEDWQGDVVDSRGLPWAKTVVRGIRTEAKSLSRFSSDETQFTLDDARAELFDLIDRTPNLTWQILTKRPENIRRMWPGQGLQRQWIGYRDNVHLIYSASDQASFDAGIGEMIGCGDLVPVVGVSLEPLVDLIVIPPEFIRPIEGTSQHGRRFIDWVIVGGESGANARPCDLAWIRSLVEQCKAAGVPVFVKQLGHHVVDNCGESRCSWPGLTQFHQDDNRCLVLLEDKKGGDWDEWPTDLRVRKFPRTEDASVCLAGRV